MRIPYEYANKATRPFNIHISTAYIFIRVLQKNIVFSNIAKKKNSHETIIFYYIIFILIFYLMNEDCVNYVSGNSILVKTSISVFI